MQEEGMYSYLELKTAPLANRMTRHPLQCMEKWYGEWRLGSMGFFGLHAEGEPS